MVMDSLAVLAASSSKGSRDLFIGPKQQRKGMPALSFVELLMGRFWTSLDCTARAHYFPLYVFALQGKGNSGKWILKVYRFCWILWYLSYGKQTLVHFDTMMMMRQSQAINHLSPRTFVTGRCHMSGFRCAASAGLQFIQRLFGPSLVFVRT